MLSLQCHLISSDLQTEWKTFRRYITNQPKEDMNEQMEELSTSSMLETVCPSLSTLAKVCLSLPVGTASVEVLLLSNENDKNPIEESPGRS